jgi:DNA-binding transcriptional LysR family regulator
MSMSLDDLEAFVAVIDNQSLTRAANALSLTQSAISRRIQHLEESLDASLFDRTSKPPKATALAHRIYERAVALLRDAGTLRDVPREDAAPSGVFRLGFSPALAEIVLFEAVMRMKTDFPALDIQLHTEWRSGLLEQVDAGTLDAAVLMLPSSVSLPESIAGRLIGKFEIVVVQSRQKPLVDSRTPIAALAAEAWILNPLGCGYRTALERAMASAGRELRLSVDTQGTEMQLRLVAAGLGLGLTPASVLRQSASYDEISVVAVPDFTLNLDVWLVHPKQPGNLKRAAEALGDAVAGRFACYTAEAPARAGKRMGK